MSERYLGVLLPITALPSEYGVGTLGKAAKEFIDFLKEARQSLWQVLPLVPTGYGNSPYASTCAIAGSPYLIDVEWLIDNGLISKNEAEEYSCASSDRVDYELLFNKRIPLLKLAYKRFNKQNNDFLAFIEGGEFSDFSLFMAIKENNSWLPFTRWEEGLRYRKEEAINAFKNAHEDEILFWQFTQYVFFLQWNEIKQYANDNGILIMGDMPLYVSDDSVEVWSKPELFMLDENGALTEVAGVPPDYFSETGQLWGNPLYNWDEMRKDGYSWWTNRLKKALNIYDYVRIDHFRGFDRFYAIPAGMTDARVGRWCDGPKEELFKDKLDWNIVAEDLGILDDGVYRLMANTGYPGMKILQFAFDSNPYHPYKPSNYSENCVAYTGTHDNATFVEFVEGLSKDAREEFFNNVRMECEKFGVTLTRNCKLQVTKVLTELAYRSKAKFVIIPIQDLLLLGKEARMNNPGTSGEWNWTWRLAPNQIKKSTAQTVARLVKKAGR